MIGAEGGFPELLLPLVDLLMHEGLQELKVARVCQEMTRVQTNLVTPFLPILGDETVAPVVAERLAPILEGEDATAKLIAEKVLVEMIVAIGERDVVGNVFLAHES